MGLVVGISALVVAHIAGVLGSVLAAVNAFSFSVIAEALFVRTFTIIRSLEVS